MKTDLERLEEISIKIEKGMERFPKATETLKDFDFLAKALRKRMLILEKKGLCVDCGEEKVLLSDRKTKSCPNCSGVKNDST